MWAVLFFASSQFRSCVLLLEYAGYTKIPGRDCVLYSLNVELIGVIPQDETVYEYDCSGKPTTGLDATNPAKKAVVGIAEKLFA